MSVLRKLPFLLLACPVALSAQNRVGTGKVAEMYQAHCAICHGDALEGGLGGSLIETLDYASDDASIQEWIRNGNDDLGMPAFGDVLSEAEIRSLVIYIREMRLKAGNAEAAGKVDSQTVNEAGKVQFQISPVVDKLSTPWSLAFLPDGALLITERRGTLRLFQSGRLLPPVEGTPEVWTHGQGGLLEVAIHPQFSENGWIYLGFSETSGNSRGSTMIVRGRVKENRWIDNEVIFSVPEKHHRSARVHFGTRFVFKDGYLYFSIGDRGAPDTAQDLSSPNGKIHRIHDDGRIPDDNPFSGNSHAFPSVWSYGHRNAQGLDLNPETGEIWESEHGPRGGDEINLIRPGLNYGWPIITYGMNYNGTPITDQTTAPGMEQPLHYWTPSIAVCGIDFYEGSLFPEWRGSLFVTGLASKELHRLVIRDGKVLKDELILRGLGRLRDVASGPDGALYLVLNGPDRIVKLLPAPEIN